jgi:hypothetical protein
MSKYDDPYAHVPSDINLAAVKVLKARSERIALVMDGMLPKTSELLSGCPWCAGSIERDIRAWCKHRILLGGNEKLLAALENLAASPGIESCNLVLEADDGELQSERDRLRLYAACLGDHDHAASLRAELQAAVTHTAVGTVDGLIKRMVAEGFGYMVSSPDEAYTRGWKRMRELYPIADDFYSAEQWIVAGEPPDPELTARADAQMKAAIEDALEDRAETTPTTKPGIVVVPTLDAGATSHKRDLIRNWVGIAGQPIPLVAAGDVVAQREALVSKWPHASEIIDIILGDLAGKDAVGFRPTCLVGAPGCGKTSLARAIAETVGVPVEIVPLGGVADSAIMGTSAQWQSARESVPLQLIRRSKVANPLLVWDEIEKASTTSHNGSALDALLPMLERRQSKHVRDPALEVECNLSAVNHFATANSLDGVPAPLRDRMRVLRMPDPSWQHIGSLAETIMWDLMQSRGLDARWLTPLAPDEIDVIKRAWPGGSLRQLVRIVETLVDGREQLWGRA